MARSFLLRHLPLYALTCLCLLVCPVVSAAADLLWESSFGFSVGRRNDRLHWQIAGNSAGNNPNILSELEWQDLQIRYMRGTGKLLLTHEAFFWPRTRVRVAYGYGRIISGHSRDTDYGADNRNDRTSLIVSDAGRGDVRDISVAAGPLLPFPDERWSLAAHLGYARSEQNLTLTDGRQVFPSGLLLPDLDSSYRTTWKGPWAGVELAFTARSNWSLTTSLAYHRVAYAAEANWNLRTDFQHPKSFDHRADGTGLVLDLEWDYPIADGWSFGVQGQYQRWRTDPGVDRLFLANGMILPTRLNRVTWRSAALNLSLRYRF